ncbi:CYFA0S08e01486g1_1 [Cyberlindnera fabianii]|uniref:CYFA0S08e01486g1_1 n=1 Tax=Cyberlindnera fabianii TaxID=36022 RepID=A0A061AXH1_CYBFA|nr:CYFA0S08e01486g1_1 [Cyberlindnera fabianii]
MSALPPDMDPTKQPLRVFKAQLLVSIIIGTTTFLTFCLLRYRWPHIYAVRTLRKTDLRRLPNTFFGWCATLYNITDEEVLEHAGLDAFVFLGFFKMAMKFFATCGAISLCFIGPIRYYYTGFFDSDGIAWDDSLTWHVLKGGDKEPEPSDQYRTAWMYTLFAYVFTWLCFYFLWRQTETVVSVRQKYLGQQNSITDRTILLEGLPEEFNPRDYTDNSSTDSLTVLPEGTSTHTPTKFDEDRLKRYIEELGIGKVSDIYIASDWKELRSLFKERQQVLRNLEVAYSRYMPLNVEVYTSGNLEPSVTPSTQRNNRSEDEPLLGGKKRPTTKLGFLGLFGEEVDSIDHYSDQLVQIDHKIRKARAENNFKPARAAFVTMDSVASAQMAAQTVLDPHVYRLIARLAPAPHDVRWENLYLSRRNKFLRANIISIIIGFSTVGLIFPVIYLSTFINLKTIQKFWPALGDIIAKSDTLTLLIGLIPPYLYTLLNVSVPYFYQFLSTLQGYISHGQVELSSLSKNFFYLFFNLFLIFTLAGTATNVWALFSDTTKVAYELANSLKTLSLFYVDLILLQGLGMFPFRLLQVGDVLLEIFQRFFYCRTARDFRKLYYVPPIFDFSLILPQHILIMIITMSYSIMSTKIVTAGLVYFVMGYYTYKYQLLYSMVHPQHSTGQSWPMIFRRVCLGLVIFQLTMAGTLALERAYVMAGLILPLLLSTCIVVYTFEKDYLPLSFFIALKAIKKPHDESHQHAISSGSANLSTGKSAQALKKRRSTIDEDREEHKTYTCPYLTDPLEGPLIGFDGDYVEQIQYDPTSLQERIVRRYNICSEWE